MHTESFHGGYVLDQVKDRDSIAYWREQASTIWGEEKISFAIDSAQEIGKLDEEQSAYASSILTPTAISAHLEVSLHGCCAIRSPSLFIKNYWTARAHDKGFGSSMIRFLPRQG
jgi:hypothetical protein